MPPEKPSTQPAAGRLLAIGDVHGCTMQLDALWKAIAPTPADTIVFLGDYVDRGPDSKGVIDRLIEWKSGFNLVCLRGNHELMMQRSKEDRDERKIWLQVGGADTLASYSPVPGRMGKFEDVPPEHEEFLDSLVDYYESESAVFVHANLDASKPLDEQIEDELFWRPLDEPIELPSGKRVICGHTSQKSGKILDLKSTLCIDTYVYGGGSLTCLDVSSLHYWQANIIGKIVEADLPPR
ncbi:MAG: metallophosphoesterase family protein [Gemmataceae bacterium]